MNNMEIAVTRKVAGEFLGSALLTIVVVGSGIAAQQLSTDIGLQLLENTLATVFGLAVLITVLGPLSGAHFNPMVSFAAVVERTLPLRDALCYLPAQVAGCVLGAVTANVMYAKAAISFSTHNRVSGPHFLSEALATAGLIFVIIALQRVDRGAWSAAIVASYIGAAYYCTSSTSFANPAITVGRMMSDSFAGIAPGSVLFLIAAQILGGVLGLVAVNLLWPRTNEIR
jgi:glycerol uptake facilitator-like aquaporin